MKVFPVFLSAVLLAFTGIIIHIALALLFYHFYQHRNNGFELLEIQPAQTAVEIDSGHLLEKVRKAENARMNSYDWVDQNRGIVRVPIHRAMDLLVEKESRNVEERQSGK